MTSVTADGFPSRRTISSSATIALVLVAFALASGAAAWLADLDPVALLSHPAVLEDNPTPSEDTPTSSFDDRFSVDSAPDSISTDIRLRPLAQFVSRELDIKLQEASRQLAQKLQSQDSRAAPTHQTAPELDAFDALPRCRPHYAHHQVPRSRLPPH